MIYISHVCMIQDTFGLLPIEIRINMVKFIMSVNVYINLCLYNIK